MTMGKLASAALGGWRRLNRALDMELGTGLSIAWRLPRQLSPVASEQARIAVAALLLSTQRLHRPVRIRLRGPDGPRAFVVPDWAGMKVLEEMFVNGEYATELPSAPRSILDLGSNIGASILFFARQYPDAAITGVEASRGLFDLLRANVGDLPNVTLRHAAVAAQPGPVVFYEGLTSWEGSTRSSGTAPEHNSYTVEGIPLDDLLGGVDLVKLDIEGGEFDVLPASRLLSSVPVMLGEIHAPASDPRTQGLLDLLPGHDVDLAPPDKDEWCTIFTAVRRTV
jgi:FkbM family methyltransferase